MKTIALLGCGQASRAISQLLHQEHWVIHLWGRTSPSAGVLRRYWPRAIWFDSLAAACTQADVVIFAVPLIALRQLAQAYGEVARGDQLALHTARGVDTGFVLPHQVLLQESCVRKIGVLGGPLHALDIKSGRPLAVVVASRFDETFSWLQEMVVNLPVMVYPTHDIVGVEVAAAVANMTSMALGLAKELELGEAAQSVLLTHGLAEAAVLGRSLGAMDATFAGLTGVGAMMPKSRIKDDPHLLLGRQLAQVGKPVTELGEFASSGLDGVVTIREAVLFAAQQRLELPLMQAMEAIVHNGSPAKATLESVLHRSPKMARTLLPSVR